MTETTIFSNVICPQCDGELTPRDAPKTCSSCNQTFPCLGKIPWLTPFPESQLVQWHHRYKLYIEELVNDESAIKLQQKAPDLMQQTKTRLSRLLQSKMEHRKGVEKILSSLDKLKGVSREGLIAAQTKLPDSFSLMGYYTNVLRDWAWPGTENQQCADIVCDVLSKADTLKELVVLGSGGSRLAYDVQNKLGIDALLATDINPFLLSVAEWMVRGNKLTLCDFPVAPIDDEHVATKWTLAAPQKPAGTFRVAAMDAMNPSFREASLDAVLTPWLIDVVPQDSRQFFAKLNYILKEGGVWANFGTLAYFHKDYALCYGFDEVEAALAECGFELIHKQRDLIPYMANPSSSQKRQETTFSFLARKVKSVTKPQRFHAWPEWVTDDQAPVPLMPKLKEMSQINATFNLMIAGVNGTSGISALADLAAPQLGVDKDQAMGLIRQLLMRVYEGSQRASRF